MQPEVRMTLAKIFLALTFVVWAAPSGFAGGSIKVKQNNHQGARAQNHRTAQASQTCRATNGFHKGDHGGVLTRAVSGNTAIAHQDHGGVGHRTTWIKQNDHKKSCASDGCGTARADHKNDVSGGERADERVGDRGHKGVRSGDGVKTHKGERAKSTDR
jgi:hypothetical protein